MLRTTLLISSILVSGLLAGCATSPVVDPPIKEPVNQVFYEPYEQVWRAIQLAFRKYPVKINSIDVGILETDFIKGDKLFDQPSGTPKPGLRYKLTIRVVKGLVDNVSATKVTILKNAEVQPDFFSGFQPVSSNGLEEEALIYRIGRFIQIDHLMTQNANVK